ncbi:hypothetical protein [Qipengyuania gelatinilytica]|uniref:DUF2842 domain-containing protein n=1 Tax=Qipengyuania gelatinilytica TaxID=2867231 RepID=A0ABX9A015_9SPHN|nr:hypothetical protein [Qipengyuania gelatinilytica]QZD94596.1 hypothetical protein K3136_10905 [Qipengyuania gelatinilytica]
MNMRSYFAGMGTYLRVMVVLFWIVVGIIIIWNLASGVPAAPWWIYASFAAVIVPMWFVGKWLQSFKE